MKLRQFGELLAQLVAANAGLYDVDAEESQLKLLNRLRDKGYLPGRINQLFHELRLAGNQASHSLSGDHRAALSNLKFARELGIWFHKSFGRDANFKAGAFIPPPDPVRESEALRLELERLRQEANESRTAVEMALAKVAEEAELRQLAEQLLQEAEAEAKAALNRLTNLQKRAIEQPTDVLQQTIRQAQQAEKEVVLDEAETRRLIDAQLRAAGWEVDSEQLTYANGTRPQKGRMRAIALLANMSVDDVVSHLRESSPTQAAQWVRDKKAIAEVLDRRDGGRQAVLISHHPDVLRSVERGYGKGEKPQDYLDSFNAFLRENLNKIPALLVVTQRPRELT
jgi:type I restriction enzyme R subunit